MTATDDAELAKQMERAELENAQVDGDDDDEEDNEGMGFFSGGEEKEEDEEKANKSGEED